MIDVVNPDEPFNASTYRRLAEPNNKKYYGKRKKTVLWLAAQVFT